MRPFPALGSRIVCGDTRGRVARHFEDAGVLKIAESASAPVSDAGDSTVWVFASETREERAAADAPATGDALHAHRAFMESLGRTAIDRGYLPPMSELERWKTDLVPD
jgi:hypothetical protein